jgi:hypothetical protein
VRDGHVPMCDVQNPACSRARLATPSNSYLALCDVSVELEYLRNLIRVNGHGISFFRALSPQSLDG